MVRIIANLYAEKAMNDKLFAEGMISEDMHRRASEGIALDIDIAVGKAYDCRIKSSERGMPDGHIERSSDVG